MKYIKLWLGMVMAKHRQTDYIKVMMKIIPKFTMKTLLTAALVSLILIPGAITADDTGPSVTGVSVTSSPLSGQHLQAGRGDRSNRTVL